VVVAKKRVVLAETASATATEKVANISFTVGPQTPPKNEVSESTPTSVAIKSVQSEVSSVGSSSSGPFDSQIKALSNGTSVPEEDQLKIHSKFNGHEPVPKLTPTSQGTFTSTTTDESSDRPYLVRSPGQGDEDGEESDASPDISQPDTSSSPHLPPEIERNPNVSSVAFSKSPAGTQPKFVEWEKVSTANEGDDDYVPLVDYSKKNVDVSKNALTIKSDNLILKSRRSVKAKRRSILLPSLAVVILAGIACFFTTKQNVVVEEVTSEYTFTPLSYDTELATNWSSSKGDQSFDVTDLSQYFAYRIRIADINEEKQALLSQESEKMELCKKPFANMRFAECRDVKKGKSAREYETNV